MVLAQDHSHNNMYNEFLIDGLEWDKDLPETIEGFLNSRNDDSAERAHSKFLSAYGLSSDQVPLLEWTDDLGTNAPPLRVVK